LTECIYRNEDEAEDGVLGQDAASYLRRILSWIMTLYYIPVFLGHDAASYLRRILSWIMTLYYIPVFLGYDAASYHRKFCPGLCYIISQQNSALGNDAASYRRRTPSSTTQL